MSPSRHLALIESAYRFTDFLVYEVDLDGKVIHLKSLEKPESPKKDEPIVEAIPEPSGATAVEPEPTSDEPWPEHFNAKLAPYLSEASILQLKEIVLQGREPPRVSDSGWGARVPKADTAEGEPTEPVVEAPATRGRDRGGRGGRGARGGRPAGREDTRKVFSEVRRFPQPPILPYHPDLSLS